MSHKKRRSVELLPSLQTCFFLQTTLRWSLQSFRRIFTHYIALRLHRQSNVVGNSYCGTKWKCWLSISNDWTDNKIKTSLLAIPTHHIFFNEMPASDSSPNLFYLSPGISSQRLHFSTSDENNNYYINRVFYAFHVKIEDTKAEDWKILWK